VNAPISMSMNTPIDTSMNAMPTPAQEARQSFVLVHIGERRFAAPANLVAELSPPVRLHRFPHTTSLVSGVIIRRGKIVPVCNASDIVGGRKSSANLFYLIADGSAAESGELLAIPVNGESELVAGEIRPAEQAVPGYICGSLLLGEEAIDVLDLRALAKALEANAGSSRAEGQS
jgi:chemotaxis signal transduction protein